MRTQPLEALSGLYFDRIDGSVDPEATAKDIVAKHDGKRVLVIDFGDLSASTSIQILSHVEKGMNALTGQHERHFALLVVTKHGEAFVTKSTIGSYASRTMVKFQVPVIAG